MIPYPAVIVHRLAHAEAALALAGTHGVALLSAPGTACYAGCGWWRALIALARARHPIPPMLDMLDCADAPGRALEALRLGQPCLLLAPDSSAWTTVQAVAETRGAVLLSARPPALDLATTDPATNHGRQRLSAWLTKADTVTRAAG